MGDKKVTQLENTLQKIAHHVEERQHYNSFNKETSGPVLDINDERSLLSHIKETIDDPDTRGFVATEDGRKMYFYNEKTNTAIIIDPDAPSGGSAFRPKTPSQGARWFQKQFDEVGRVLGKMPDVTKGGLKAVSEVLEKTGGKWAKLVDLFGDVAKGAGKTLKILGPLGVVGALCEGNELLGKAYAAVDYGVLNPNAMIEYDAMIAAHVAQATADPSMVCGEAAVQLAYDAWCEKWDVPDYLQESLEPSSLVEMVFGEIAVKNKENFYNELPAAVEKDNAFPPELDAMIAQKRIINHFSPFSSMGSQDATDRVEAAQEEFDQLYTQMLESGNVEDYLKAMGIEGQETPPMTPIGGGAGLEKDGGQCLPRQDKPVMSVPMSVQ